MTRSHVPPHHVTFLDHVLAATRNECNWLCQEEKWDARGELPATVLRRYARVDVFHRDLGRMLDLGYSVGSIRSEGPGSEIRVMYVSASESPTAR